METHNRKRQNIDDILAIKEFLEKCRRKWWWFVASVGICMACAVLYLKTTRPTYTRSAAVMIKEDSNSKSASSFMNQMSKMGNLTSFSSSSDVQNEILVMQSPDITLEAVKRLGLDYNYTRNGLLRSRALYGKTLPVVVRIDGLDDEQSVSLTLSLDSINVTVSDIKTVSNGQRIEDGGEYACTIGSKVQTSIGAISVERSGSHCPLGKQKIRVVRAGYYAATLGLQKRLSFSLSNKLASVINITCRDENPQRAEDVINTVISVYNESWVRDKNILAVSTSEFINERISIIEKELSNVDAGISDIKSSKKMVDMAQANMQALTQTATSENALRNMTSELYMIDYIKKYIQSDTSFRLLPTGMGLSNTAVQNQITSYNTMVLQRNSLVKNSSEHNRLVMDLDTQLTEMREAILTGLNNDYMRLKNSISAEQGNISAYERKISNSPLHERDLLSVERQQKVKEALYIYLLQKREENELSQAFTAYNTRIVTTPKGSMIPSSPKGGIIYLFALMLGLAVPLCLVYFATLFDTKLRSKADLNGLSIPFLGEIPHYDGGKSLKRKALGMKIIFQANSRKVINEAFRVVRTNMEFMLNNIEGNKNVIMTTSLNPASGKSLLLANIAASEAQKGRRVVIVDLDLRRSSTSQLVDNPDNGISNYLAGFSDKCNVVPVEGQEGLFVIPVGILPPNPTELLYSPKLQELIDMLRQEYDYVFLDCPPVNIVADTSIISALADMTIFVVRAALLERSLLPEIEDLYREQKFRNMGLILNGTKDEGGRYGYQYGYGKYYDKD